MSLSNNYTPLDRAQREAADELTLQVLCAAAAFGHPWPENTAGGVSMTLQCPECETVWRVVVSVYSGPHICPNTNCPKRERELAWPWVAEALMRSKGEKT